MLSCTHILRANYTTQQLKGAVKEVDQCTAGTNYQLRDAYKEKQKRIRNAVFKQQPKISVRLGIVYCH